MDDILKFKFLDILDYAEIHYIHREPAKPDRHSGTHRFYCGSRESSESFRWGYSCPLCFK